MGDNAPASFSDEERERGREQARYQANRVEIQMGRCIARLDITELKVKELTATLVFTKVELASTKVELASTQAELASTKDAIYKLTARLNASEAQQQQHQQRAAAVYRSMLYIVLPVVVLVLWRS